MTSQNFVVDGVTYVRSRDAARAVDLTMDYVSRLARFGVVSGQRVGGMWFIEMASLQRFVARQERQKALLRIRMSEMRREEQRRLGHPSALLA